MRGTRTRRGWAAVAAAGTALAVTAALSPVTPASAVDDSGKKGGGPSLLTRDTRELSPREAAKLKKIDQKASQDAVRRARLDGLAGRTKVGAQKSWLALDETSGYYLKRFQLRGKGKHIQVWVANDRAFPLDDCRNDLGLTEVTQAQVDNFIRQFKKIYRTESRVFSTPPRRAGKKAPITSLLGLPTDYYTVKRKESDDIVVLVDNVRDANFYDPTTPDGQTFIAGFFSSTINFYTRRNVMTIDAYDWRHRTGANPPDDSQKAAYKRCAAALGNSTFGTPRPFDYEGTFAHEYQHLLESYEDADEVNWVNEGLSDYAQTITGFADTRIPVRSKDADGHLRCFGGFLEPSFGGPENSLTQWEDQGGPEILCDYGAAYSFMEYLHSHYGNKLMSRLHRNNANGLDGLARVLKASGVKASPTKLIRRWAAMEALDRKLDRNGGRITGGSAKAFTARTLGSMVRWSNPQAYNAPGAPANGSDYVRMRASGGSWLGAGEVDSIAFTGAAELAPAPVEWTVDANPPGPLSADDRCGDTLASGGGGAALYSGCGDSLDRSLVREVTLPAGNPQLTFDANWSIEPGWDFAFVQVSDDDGETWHSLPATSTTTEHDPSASADIVAQLPGFDGTSNGWVGQTVDLSQYAGKTVQLGFRYMTDEAEAYPGFWVRNISVAGTAVPATLADWQTETQVNPMDVDGWTVQVVAYGSAKERVRYVRVPLHRSGDTVVGTLSGADLSAAIGRQLPLVAAIVTHADPDETATGPAAYQLTVNGTEIQPGGGTLP